MGAPAHISIPAPASSISSPGGSIFSSSETETSVTSSSPSLPVSSSSSFTHHDFSVASSADSKARQEIINHQQKEVLPEWHMGDDARVHDAAGLGNLNECTRRKPLKGGKRALMHSSKSCSMGLSRQKTCFRCAGAFAADCAALCCCPCAIVSLLAFIMVELPSALATRMIAHVKKRLSVKDSANSCSSNNQDGAHAVSTPTRSHREESCKGTEAQAVHLIRFDTENLLKHFDAEHVGFGCLSLKRE